MTTKAGRMFACVTAGLLVAFLSSAHAEAQGAVQSEVETLSSSGQADFIRTYCVQCHNGRALVGGVVLDTADLSNLGTDIELWERALRKLRARAMPPIGMPRPDEDAYANMVSHLETELDRLAVEHLNPGRTDTFRRLTRTEYRNAIRDLLALDVDVTALLPRDDASFGFDNVGVVGLSPLLMERYLSAAQKISRLAVGPVGLGLDSHVVVLPVDLTQENHFDGLPFGTRGGAAVTYQFPLDGEYDIQVWLSRNRNENVEGLTEPHDIEITLNDERIGVFTITPNRNRFGDYYADEDVDKGLVVRVLVKAGPHKVGASFIKKNSALIETERQPYQAHFNMNRHPRVQPAVRSVSITGPYESTGAGRTPSRERIFSCRPDEVAQERECAKTIVSNLARLAYRRPVTNRDIDPLLDFYDAGYEQGDFEGGIETALRALLASPEFLFRVERDPHRLASGEAYRLSDIELATRLSFFLWSSLPDNELLTVAEREELSDPGVLEAQVLRMLRDPRAESLSTNFASQWLHLRNLDAAKPNLRSFPDFDENLRRGFRRETEMFFGHIVEQDSSVLQLLSADFTFVNERVAKHYGLPHVYGDQFRLVELDPAGERIGLLSHGSILTVTSYATRTSPVLRGKWVLENLLGMPPPPPPPNVPPLAESGSSGQPLSMRERMAQHRENPTCAACHQLMDPAGLSMENFDAIGRWRSLGEGRSEIDASGSLPGGLTFSGVSGLREAVLSRPELFVGTLTEKLLTYALGRGIDYRDASAVRTIVRDVEAAEYRFSSLILGIVRSVPFQMRRTQ